MNPWQSKVKDDRGVLCGCDSQQEWLLPWWWERYSEENSLPVTFVDFGMTDKARRFCAERGRLVTLEVDTSFVKARSEIDPVLAQEWEERHGWTMWNARRSWFKKPFAFLSSPYQRTLWMDLDCEVLSPIEEIFDLAAPSGELALVREFCSQDLPLGDPQMRYNGGVVLFQHGSPLIVQWADAATRQNHLYSGDDHLLSNLIYEQKIDVVELPEVCNWRLCRGFNLNAMIVHWIGSGGKNYIRLHGGLKPSIDAFYRNYRNK